MREKVKITKDQLIQSYAETGAKVGEALGRYRCLTQDASPKAYGFTVSPYCSSEYYSDKSVMFSITQETAKMALDISNAMKEFLEKTGQKFPRIEETSWRYGMDMNVISVEDDQIEEYGLSEDISPEYNNEVQKNWDNEALESDFYGETHVFMVDDYGINMRVYEKHSGVMMEIEVSRGELEAIAEGPKETIKPSM